MCIRDRTRTVIAAAIIIIEACDIPFEVLRVRSDFVRFMLAVLEISS